MIKNFEGNSILDRKASFCIESDRRPLHTSGTIPNDCAYQPAEGVRMKFVGLAFVAVFAMTSLAGCTRHDRHEAREDIREAIQDVKRARREAAEEGRRAAMQAREEIREATREVREELRKAKEELRQAKEELRQEIQRAKAELRR